MLCLRVLFLLASKMCVIRKRYTPIYNLCALGFYTSSYGQGWIKVKEYLELLFFSTINIFLSFFPVRFVLLSNGENLRLFLLFHISSLSSCYSLYILYTRTFFSSCMFFSTPAMSLVCHHYHQRNILCCCAVTFISQSFKCAKH